jgi:hypothetical protein
MTFNHGQARDGTTTILRCSKDYPSVSSAARHSRAIFKAFLRSQPFSSHHTLKERARRVAGSRGI